MKTAVAMLVLCGVMGSQPLAAAPPARTYPRVYGPTGRLYGPTQADYQYQQQYGTPWHGLNGVPGGVGPGYVNGYPWYGGRHFHAASAYCAPFLAPPVFIDGYAVYGYFDYAPAWPLLNPVDTRLPLEHQAAMQDFLQQERGVWDSPLESLPVEELPRRFIKPSSDAAKLRSIRVQHEGDLHFRALDYSAAARDYQRSLAAAQDRPEPYFRLGLTDAARGNFRNAVLQLKLGLQLAPRWPHEGERFDDLIGEQNLMAKTLIKQRVVDWVQEDIRDPDRLFLLGVLLHIDGDAERAAILFETAARLGGMKQHLHAFLNPAPGGELAGPPDDRGRPGGVPQPEPPPRPEPPPQPLDSDRPLLPPPAPR